MTTSCRGPWTPSTRFSSMSLVADGPETSTIGRPSRALGSSAAISSGTDSTIAVRPDHADVEVGHEAQRAAALARPAVEGDRAGDGAARRTGRQRTVEHVELARRQLLVLDELEPVGPQCRIEVGRDADPLRSGSTERLGRSAPRVAGDDDGGAVVPHPLDEQVEHGGSVELARLAIRARHVRRRRPPVERDADPRQDGVTPGHGTPTTRGMSARAAPGGHAIAPRRRAGRAGSA